MLVYGKNILKEIDKKRIKKVYCARKEYLDYLQNNKIHYEFTDINRLNKMVSGLHQGIVIDVFDYEYKTLNDVVGDFVVMLDHIEDPHNFGAIIRSADAFGVDGIIIKDRNQADVTPTVYKVSTGAIEHVRIAKVSNLSNVIKVLKKNGFWIYAAAGEGAEEYHKQNYNGKNAIIVGNEGVGISKLVRENSDFIIKIPMIGHVNSLNVSVATGILLSRIRNK